MAVSSKKGEISYPYGKIKVNSYGFPDDEFDLGSGGKHIGYLGDSVIYGIGAGYGYRISEILEKKYNEYEHMNFGMIGIHLKGKENVINIIKMFKLDHVIYFFNLNDVLPNDKENTRDKNVSHTKKFIKKNLDWLRGKSYLYTFIRNTIKSYLIRRGYGYHGYMAYELFPSRYKSIIKETAGRINEYHKLSLSLGVDFTVVILPLEMQISKEAENTYANLNIHWEQEFIDRGTQKVFIKHLNPEIVFFDAYFAFVDEENIEESRKENKVGEFFVYNKGDKLDWNHPNRKGHKAIAEYLFQKGVFATKL